MKDPIIEEVRRHRMEHTSKHAGDLSSILADLREIQKRSGHEIVRLPPRKKGENGVAQNGVPQ